jgi:uncharacterized protein DUF4340
MSRNRTTFIYLALFLGLVCYLTFIDKKIPGTKDQEESETELYKLDPADVTGLEVTNVHGTFIFQKDNGHWEIKSPVNTPADGPTVEEVINQIAYAQPLRTIKIDGDDKDTQANLKEWGLSPAAERAVIHTKDKNYELLIGRKMAINDSVYARGSGRKNEPVRILPNMVKSVLQKDLSDFRSRNVFDFDAEKAVRVASRITQTAPAEECEVELKEGKWTLQKPLVARADANDVQSLLTKMLALHVVDFITDDATNLSTYGLTSPVATLSVTLQPAEDMVLQIGGPVPGKPDQVYAQRTKSDSVFTVTKAGVDDAFKALPDVRDRHVLPFDPGKASGLAYSLGKKSADVRRDQGLWNAVGKFPGRADIGKVTDALARLSQLETTPTLKDSAPDLKPFGLDKPQAKITIQTGDKASPTLTLLVGKEENKLFYVRNSMEPFIYTVPENAFDFLPDSNLALLDARAIDLQLPQVHSMTVTAPPEPPIVLTRSNGGTWTATNVKDRMVDSVKADTQASLFCQLQAKTWLGPAQSSYGLAKPVLTLEVQTDQPQPTILHIGALLPDGGRAAQIEGSPNTFEISDGDYGELDASSLMPIPPGGLPATNVAPATNAAPKGP